MPDDQHRIRVALELNALHASGAFGDALEGAHIGTGTPIYDLHGKQLYERIPLTGESVDGYADVAVDPAMGAVLMAVSDGFDWNQRDLLAKAERAVSEHLAPGSWDPGATQFVAYSYPKLAVKFSRDGKELALLELFSWRPVPPERQPAPNDMASALPFQPTYFERWSFLDRPPVPERLVEMRESFNARVSEIVAIPGRDWLTPDRIARRQFTDLIDPTRRPPSSSLGTGGVDSDLGTGGGEVGTGDAGSGSAAAGAPASQGDLHFKTRGINHATCYEVQGQATPVWCVAASIGMLLDFYRYEYTQDRLAAELGLGTVAHPKDLPAGQEAKVANVIEALTSNALDVTKLDDPTWDDFRTEIVANRPVISFVPGHARTVAGYVDTGPVTSGLGPFRGLLVYDPWPPTNGVVTRWENVAVQIYKAAFLARLQLA